MRNNPIRPQYLILIFFVAVLSLGAWWDLGKPKKEEPKKQSQINSSVSQAKKSSKNITSEKKEQKPEGTVPRLQTETQSDFSQPVDATNVQKELSEIIDRTSKLQGEVKGNRTEILQIMERAQIHDRILKTIKMPQPVKMPVKVVDADAIVRQEKLRLIAAQTQQAQKQLETIQRTRNIESQRT